MPKISYMCSQTKFPTKTVFKIFVNLEMTGHLGAGESLSRAVGRAHSLTNVPLHPDSRLCFQPCLPPLPCKADMAPATLDDSSLTRAVFVSHCALPHSLFLPSECPPPPPNQPLLILPSQPKTTILMILSLPLYVLKMTVCFAYSPTIAPNMSYKIIH